MIDGSEKRKRQLVLNFRVRVFMKSAVRDYSEWEGYTDKMINLLPPISVAATKW